MKMIKRYAGILIDADLLVWLYFVVESEEETEI